MKKLLIITLLFVCFNHIFAQENNLFSPEIKRVAVFKNGYAFTYREAETITNNGWAYTAKPPIGVLGTVWGYSTTPNVKVNQLLASEVVNSTTERVSNLTEFLIANEGAKIRIEVATNEGKAKVYEGVYEIISSFRGFKTSPRTSDESYLAAELSIAIKTENGVLVFNANKMENVEVIGQPKWSKPKAEKQIRLGIKTEGAASGQKVNLGIAALERGIRWIPAYRVEVKGDPIKEAKLELEANIINELADLNNSEINFVVGVPHFLFQDTASPLSINTAFAGVSSNFGRDRRNEYSNAMQSQVSSQSSSDEITINAPDPSPTSAEEEKTTSFSAEQLYLYQTNQLNLKKGERATMRLFSLTVPCSEVFEWTINDVKDAQARYMNSNYSNQNEQINSLQDLSTKVWYALKLKNTTGMPWTTAPAISFREWKPLGQDMLKFTAIGGEEVLRVTPATEVVGTHKLEEKSRMREKLRWNGSDYEFDLVTVEGTIKLRNVKKQPIEIVLTRNLVGEVESASDNGKIIKDGLNLQSINSNSIVKWNITIPSGEKEIKYTYKVYVRK
jgi:hypothetical protein